MHQVTGDFNILMLLLLLLHLIPVIGYMIIVILAMFRFLTFDLLINFLLQLNQSGNMSESIVCTYDPRDFEETEDDVSLIVVQHQVFGFKENRFSYLYRVAAPFDEIAYVISGIERLGFCIFPGFYA